MASLPQPLVRAAAPPGSAAPIKTDLESALQKKALKVHALLCPLYNCPIPFFAERDPLSELVSSLLSHRTKNRDSAKAYQHLRQRLPTWEDVRDAPESEVRSAITDATWPEQKAPRIQTALRQITERHGSLNLSFLAQMKVTEARAWLEAIPGVGPKTSAATLLFSNLRRPALPVDSHHYRVAARIGLIAPGTSLEAAHRKLEALLPCDWDAQHVYDHHEVLMLHGQRCCFFERPACERCPANAICDAYNTGKVRATGAARAEQPVVISQAGES
jgi:endonuclease III